MLTVAIASLLLVALTTLIHYEALRALNAWLPHLRIPNRRKLLVVMLSASAAHVLEIGVYGLAIYALVRWAGVGQLVGGDGASMVDCLYVSVQTYTSLGYGDVAPVGPLRFLAGIETLNGLLLIGWTASYTYIAMERFWRDGHRH